MPHDDQAHIERAQEMLLRLAREASGPKLADMADIPKVDLYMEQVTSFFDDMLRDSRRSADEKILTKTMVNNYTKAGTLPRPEKKKYSRDHIVRLMLIFLLKQSLAMQDIKTLLDSITAQGDITKVYQLYLDLAQESQSDYMARMESRIERIRAMLEEKQMLSAENLVFLAVMDTMGESMDNKLLAGRILDSIDTTQGG